MNMKLFAATAFVCLSLPFAAGAQGVVRGAAEGAHEGNRDAGPVGAVVGGAVGAVSGGVAGLLGVDQHPRFRAYVAHEHRSSYSYDRPVAIGSELPGEGVSYYEVPSEYGVREYRYTVVNGQTVLVDPRTHRIVEIIN
jgi:Protein of unknown function (DUF1236)